MRLPWRIWLPALLLTSGAVADKSEVKVSLTKFDSLPRNLFLFDDSETAIFTDQDAGIVYRSTNFGEDWSRVDDIPKGEPHIVYKHPSNNKVALALGRRKKHWITKDQGKNWRLFETDDRLSPVYPLSFHSEDSDRILLQAEESCDYYGCVGKTWYTEDGFDTVHLLHGSRKMCQWAKTHERFTTGSKSRDQNLVICIVEGKYSHRIKDYRLVMSEDYFKNNEVEPEMADGRTVSGMVNMAAVKGYIVAAAKSEGTDELALYVTDDANIWHRAEFGEHKLEEDAYTILESTNYSIQVDVKPSKRNEMGVLFTSNSNGTYFTRNIEHTNRNEYGLVDFEKITDIQGIFLVNTVANWEEVEKSWFADKVIKSSISFDDGRTFQDLKVGKERLHLHSVTDQRNSGKVFSSPAPGLVMGIGNTGGSLRSYDQGDLFVSDDAGATWKEALKGPHKYEFGDQGAVLVAVYEGETDQVMYSIDHGRNWEPAKLEEGNKFRALELTTIPDSTSLRFILVGVKGGGSQTEHQVYMLDFEGLHERKCKEGDFETWYAREDEEGNVRCIMGHKQRYRRRKADADCFVDEEFKDPQPEYEPCTCTEEDFECDYNFIRSGDRKQCLPAGKLSPPEGACKDIDDKFMGSSGWRLIPGNDCDRKGGVNKDEPVERPCRETVKPPASGKITHEITTFRSDAFKEYYYLERTDSSSGDDETVVMKTGDGIAYISHDHGKSWEEAVPDDKVVAIYPHRYFNDVVYFITATKRVYYSKNRGKTIHTFNAPEGPNRDRLQIMGFHPQQKDWLIWMGGKGCDRFFGDDCHTVAHISRKGGEEWDTLLPYVQKCEFVSRQGSEQLIYCEQYEDEDKANPLQLIASEDWFEHQHVHFKDVVNFATMSEFIVVAAKTEDRKYLRAASSIDGKTFAQADFPPNFQVPHQSAYTVLDSSTHAIFLHVTVNNNQDQEYGSIIKSNSNGTSYVLSLNNVNRNTLGYVDFEKMQGLEGVAVVNVVANVKEVDGGASKKLKTQITHNDGAEWQLLTPPDKDADGKRYCTGDLNTCSLHLHGYTERKDPSRDTFSSASAVGLMMGVGNVGEYLGRYKEGDTFITRDGGLTWNAVMKGTFMWEYGDQGSIIVIVEESTPTDRVYYTLDEGTTWTEYQFSEAKMQIDDISTVPSDTSRNFLLWGRETTGAENIVTINLDFAGLTDRQCNLDDSNPTAPDSDYTLWEPKHPMEPDNCLFGHVAQYHRKKLDSNCYNGKREIVHLHNIAKNCSCTRRDYECDYNYERQNDGTCALVPGLAPPDPMRICKENPNAFEYYEVTGYRRIPITTCQHGTELDAIVSHPCPGHEDEYQEKKGISGAGLFFAIVLPFAAAAGVGYWVWRNWDGKFGRIRLGDTSSGFDSDRPWVKWPVAAISGLVAVLAAIPLLATSLWRSVSGRFGGGYGGRTYTSRSSFARGRGDYAVVDPDEGELLGEDSDEEV